MNEVTQTVNAFAEAHFTDLVGCICGLAAGEVLDFGFVKFAAVDPDPGQAHQVEITWARTGETEVWARAA